MLDPGSAPETELLRRTGPGTGPGNGFDAPRALRSRTGRSGTGLPWRASRLARCSFRGRWFAFPSRIRGSSAASSRAPRAPVGLDDPLLLSAFAHLPFTPGEAHPVGRNPPEIGMLRLGATD